MPVSEQSEHQDAEADPSLVADVVDPANEVDHVPGRDVDVDVAGSEAGRRPTLLRVRRAPRYRSFGGTGAGIGIVAGVLLALSFSATSDYSIQTIVGYFAAIFGLIGAVLGLGLAVLIERRRA